MKQLNKNDAGRWFDALSEKFDVFVPSRKDDKINYSLYRKDGEFTLDYINTLLPAKDLFFPQTEKLYGFKTSGKSLEIMPETAGIRPRVLFGLRPCDVKSISLLDNVFLKDFVDETYKTKREATVIISLACNEKSETCFCDIFGIARTGSEGADVAAVIDGDRILFDAVTPKGKNFLDENSSMLTENLSAEAAQQTAAAKADAQKGTSEIETITQTLAAIFDSPYWEKLSRKCLSCGICSYLCPTCHCFDIQTVKAGQEGQRIRCWDNCMFSDFTRMAGGHNPRPTKKERIRQRIMHKLRFFPERYGDFACVGCGRCLRSCPVGMDMVSIINKIKDVVIE